MAAPQDKTTGLEINWHMQFNAASHAISTDCIKKAQFINLNSILGSSIGLAVQTRNETIIYALEGRIIKKVARIPEKNHRGYNGDESFDGGYGDTKDILYDLDSKQIDTESISGKYSRLVDLPMVTDSVGNLFWLMKSYKKYSKVEI